MNFLIRIIMLILTATV